MDRGAHAVLLSSWYTYEVTAQYPKPSAVEAPVPQLVAHAHVGGV
jgi:hypothetical protein